MLTWPAALQGASRRGPTPASPLDGIRRPARGRLSYATGTDPGDELAAAGQGFTLRAGRRDVSGTVIGDRGLPHGRVRTGDGPQGSLWHSLDTEFAAPPPAVRSPSSTPVRAVTRTN